MTFFLTDIENIMKQDLVKYALGGRGGKIATVRCLFCTSSSKLGRPKHSTTTIQTVEKSLHIRETIIFFSLPDKNKIEVLALAPISRIIWEKLLSLSKSQDFILRNEENFNQWAEQKK